MLLKKIKKWLEPPLLKALSSKDFSLMKDILDETMNPNVKDWDKNYPLIVSIENGYLDVLKLLLDYSANTNVKNKKGDTGLIIAAKKKNYYAVKLLLEKGKNTNVNFQDENGDTALIIAARNKDYPIFDLLVNFEGTKFNLLNNKKLTASCVAALQGYLLIVKQLTSCKNAHDNKHFPSLICASSGGNIDIVKHLVRIGANVNATDDYGNTALLLATMHNNVEIAKFLLENGANHICNNNYSYPWQYAIKNKNLDMIKIFVEFGIYTNNTFVWKSTKGNN